MAISYSGIVNYGKVSLPSVGSWGTNMNILRDPPKSVQTRKIDRVGQTSAITTAIDGSDDRFCESINYYARGQNPMVAVSYGQGQKKSTAIGGGESFLPYRIAREGAFRPPVWRQEDLLPLSRQPRIWTNVSSQPYKPIFTKRIKNCGTSENMREVKNDTLQVSCIANKTIAAYPTMNQPDMKPGILKDPTAPGQVTTTRSSIGSNNAEIVQRMNRAPILLAPSRPMTSGFTNPTSIKEKPVVLNNVKLNMNRPNAMMTTNPTSIKEKPVVLNNVKLNMNRPNAMMTTNPTSIKEKPVVLNNVRLSLNHPQASATTNFAAPSFSSLNKNTQQFTRLPPRSHRGGFDGCPGIPKINGDNQMKTLLKVR
jgi:hypothetical protein